ncbi:hypothetical protein MASR1M65_18670 [Saprospiraceae bacterium]
MAKRSKIVFIIISALLLLTPLTIYLIHFYGQSLSDDTETWGHFGDYLNGTFMPIIALVGIIVTLLLGLISERRNESKLKIDQQKQRPLLHLGYFDCEDFIRIFLKNRGSGPLIITNYRLVNLQTQQQIQSVFEILPPIQGYFNNYTGNQNNTVLSVDEETELFLYKPTEGDGTIIENDRTLIRQAISQYKIVIDYKDVYDNTMPTYERSLEWFGRNINVKKSSR